jgi:hypothetical protein
VRKFIGEHRSGILAAASLIGGFALSLALQRGFFDATPNSVVFSLFILAGLLFIIGCAGTAPIRNCYHLVPKHKVMSLSVFIILGGFCGFSAWVLLIFTKIIPPEPRKEAIAEVSVYNTPSAYPEGHKVAGMDWNSNLVPMKIELKTFKKPVLNFDMRVLLDEGGTSIKSIGQITDFPGMTTFPTGDLQRGPDKLTVGHQITLVIKTPEGEIVPHGIDQTKDGTIAPIWRVHFDRLLPETTVVLLVAGFRFRPDLFPPGKIANVRMGGSYEFDKDGSLTNKTFEEFHEFFKRNPTQPPEGNTNTHLNLKKEQEKSELEEFIQEKEQKMDPANKQRFKRLFTQW